MVGEEWHIEPVEPYVAIVCWYVCSSSESHRPIDAHSVSSLVDLPIILECFEAIISADKLFVLFE
jgi:hypothetical protein